MNKARGKQAKRVKAQELPPTGQPYPDWVRDMHGHFQAHGYYRPEDLQRVLGDPRDRVECVVMNDPQLACRREAE